MVILDISLERGYLNESVVRQIEYGNGYVDYQHHDFIITTPSMLRKIIMQHFKYRVVLIAMASIAFGCGDPEVYLIKDGESEFHLQWTKPLKKPRIVLFYIVEFDNFGSPYTNSYLCHFPAGEFRSRLFVPHDFAYHFGLLSVELPPATIRDTLDRPHDLWDATTYNRYLDTILVGHPFKSYDVGKPSKLTFDSIDVQQVYLEKGFRYKGGISFDSSSEGQSTGKGYTLYLAWKPGNLRIARYVLIRITPSGQRPEEFLLFFPSGTTRLILMSPLLQDRIWELEGRARAFRHDPETSIVEILPAENLDKLKLPTTATTCWEFLGPTPDVRFDESVSVPVEHKFLPYDVGQANTHRGNKVFTPNTHR